MPISKPKRRAKIISDNEFKEVINGVFDPMHKALFCLLYGTGARIGEVVRKLKPSDIQPDNGSDLEVKLITEKHKKSPLRAVYIVAKPKGEAERNWLIEPILRWKEQCPYKFLFPISRERAWQLTNRYFGTKPHSFRHSDATRSGGRGLNIWEMQQRYGWTRISSSLPYIMAFGKDSKKKL